VGPKPAPTLGFCFNELTYSFVRGAERTVDLRGEQIQGRTLNRLTGNDPLGIAGSRSGSGCRNITENAAASWRGRSRGRRSTLFGDEVATVQALDKDCREQLGLGGRRQQSGDRNRRPEGNAWPLETFYPAACTEVRRERGCARGVATCKPQHSRELADHPRRSTTMDWWSRVLSSRPGTAGGLAALRKSGDSGGS